MGRKLKTRGGLRPKKNLASRWKDTGKSQRWLTWSFGAALLSIWCIWDPGSLYPYFDAKYVLCAAAAICLFIPWLFSSGIRLRWVWLDCIWALWLGWSALSLTFLPDCRIGLVDLGQRLAVAIVYPLVRFIAIKDPQARRMVGWAVVIGLGVEATTALVQLAGAPGGLLTSRLSAHIVGTLGFHTFVGAFLVTGFPLEAWLWSGSGRCGRRLLVAIAAGVLSVLVAVQSRGAWLAILLAAVVWAWRAGLIGWRLPSKRRRWSAMAGLAVAVLFLAGLMFASRHNPGGMWVRTAQDLNGRDLAGRKVAWVTGIHLLEQATLFGGGLGSFYYQYIPEQGMVLESRPPSSFGPLQETVIWAHDEFLQEAVEGGLVGLALMAGLLGGGLLSALRGPAGDSEGAALAGSLCGWCVMALVDFPLHRPSESLLLFVILALVSSRIPPSPTQEPVARRTIPVRPLALVCLVVSVVALGITGCQFLARRELHAALRADSTRNFQEAQRLFARSTHLAPNPGQSLAAYGAYLCKQGDVTQGLALMEKAEQSFRDVFLYENLGKAYMDLGQDRHALRMFRLAAGGGIHYKPDRVISAWLEWSAGHKLEAIKQVEALHAYAPANLLAATFLAGRYYAEGNYKACLEVLRPALFKGSPAIANLEAAAQVRLGLLAQAGETLSKLVKSYPSYAPAWVNLGGTYLLRGDGDQASGAFRHALALEPSNSVILEELETLASRQDSVGTQLAQEAGRILAEQLQREARLQSEGLAGQASAVAPAEGGGHSLLRVPAGGVIVYGVAPDPYVAGRLFAATSSGLYKSEDKGACWKVLGLQGISADLGFVKGAPNILFYGSTAGLLRSTDGGASWVPYGPPWLHRCIWALAVSPSDGKRILIGMPPNGAGDFGGIWLSNDGGQSFSPVHVPDLPASACVPRPGGLAFGSGHPPRVWACTYASADSPMVSAPCLLCSNDGGTTWSEVVSHEDWNSLFVGWDTRSFKTIPLDARDRPAIRYQVGDSTLDPM